MVVLSDGLQEILKGAATSGTIVSVGGLQTVLSGGSIWIAVLFADGVQILRDGAEVYGATVSSDGSQVVSSGCSASGCRIVFGGTQTVSSDGIDSDTVVKAGGMQVVIVAPEISINLGWRVMPRRLENGLSSPSQNALCSASTRKKAFATLSPKWEGENDLFWRQFSGLSRLMEGLVCSGRWLPGALKKSLIFVLPSEPLYQPGLGLPPIL